ncbi:MAG TPA: hypothetical protein GX507_10410 [Clostridia bacterium]|nr:hypothetical protein [Clostridia bacterium]
MAYDLRNQDWSFVDRNGKKSIVSPTALNQVVRIFRESPVSEALSLIEKLPTSPFARYGSLSTEYRKILEVLRIERGKIDHPWLRDLSPEDLVYVLGWLRRLYRAGIEKPRTERQASSSGTHGLTRNKKIGNGRVQPIQSPLPSRDVEDIDPRLGKLRDWKPE